MASGHVNRIQRPNTWLHRPMLQREKALANSEPSTHGPKRTLKWRRSMSALRGEADSQSSLKLGLLLTRGGPANPTGQVSWVRDHPVRSTIPANRLCAGLPRRARNRRYGTLPIASLRTALRKMGRLTARYPGPPLPLFFFQVDRGMRPAARASVPNDFMRAPRRRDDCPGYPCAPRARRASRGIRSYLTK